MILRASSSFVVFWRTLTTCRKDHATRVRPGASCHLSKHGVRSDAVGETCLAVGAFAQQAPDLVDDAILIHNLVGHMEKQVVLLIVKAVGVPAHAFA
jgi:hypothetical protein